MAHFSKTLGLHRVGEREEGFLFPVLDSFDLASFCFSMLNFFKDIKKRNKRGKRVGCISLVGVSTKKRETTNEKWSYPPQYIYSSPPWKSPWDHCTCVYIYIYIFGGNTHYECGILILASGLQNSGTKRYLTLRVRGTHSSRQSL